MSKIDSPGSPTTRAWPRSAAIAVAALAVAGVTGGCGSSSTSSSTTTAPPGATAPTRNLDTQRVATAIKQSVQQQRHLRVHVVCPQQVVQKKGVHFVCIASSKKTGRTPFAVTITNDQGFVTYAAGAQK